MKKQLFMSLLCLILFFIIQPSKNCHITNNGHFIFIAIRKSKKKKRMLINIRIQSPKSASLKYK